MNEPLDHDSGPLHSIATCPICGGGLCGVRICTGDDPTEAMPGGGFVMCDECEAVWMEPDVATEHVYVDPEKPQCPICRSGLWSGSRWADRNEVQSLGWASSMDPKLDARA
jgi:hypothetical protein